MGYSRNLPTMLNLSFIHSRILSVRWASMQLILCSSKFIYYDFNTLVYTDFRNLLAIRFVTEQWRRIWGESTSPKDLMCRQSLKIWAKPLKISAQMLWHICSICVINETDWVKTSEFDVSSPKKNIFCVTSKKRLPHKNLSGKFGEIRTKILHTQTPK